MRFIFSNKDFDLNLIKDFSRLQYQKIGSRHLLINDPKTITDTPEHISVVNGYLRDFQFEDLSEQKVSAISKLWKKWPLPDNITGSFSAFSFNKTSSEFIISTDPVNIYPLYYLKQGDSFYISNSIILVGRFSNAPLDDTGVFQRAVGPNFMNIGSRTILENCKSILPGEWIRFDEKGDIIEKKYDNSLYQNLSSSSFQKDQIEEYWAHYKKEVALCTLQHEEVNIALSGGLDSRIALGAIPNNKTIYSYTFGSPKNYEVKIAKKLSKKKGAHHTACFYPEMYFPPKNILEQYTRDTESVKLNSWLEILEKIDKQEKKPLLLGELCEGLPARNIKKYSSSSFRKKNLINYYLKNQEFSFTKSSSLAFQSWKKQKIEILLSWHDNNWFNKLGKSNSKEKIINSSKKDIEEIFNRIEDHQLAFTELYDELFSWYTFTRMELSKQVTICNEKFYAFSPGMSLQMLKRTSNIHPNLRLLYRFTNKLLESNNDLNLFRRIPTSQIPLLPQSSNNIFKIPVWGLRSRIDDWLVKRMMNKGNISSRYRLFNSVNWAKIYHLPSMLKNINQYYDPNNLTKQYFQTFYKLAEERRELKKWPFANMDIISGAALNTEMDLIKRYRNQTSDL